MLYLRFRILLFLGLISISLLGQEATINKVWVDSDVTKNQEKGIVVHTDFNVKGMLGKTIKYIVFFYDKDKNPISSESKGYRTTNNTLCAYSEDIATYENTRWKDYDLFIPYNVMNLELGTHEYYCFACIRDAESNSLTTSDWINFTLNIKQTCKKLPDGRTLYITYNADGSTTYKEEVPCYSCNSKGKCTTCNGQGGRWIGYGLNSKWRPCMRCFGKFVCYSCKGQGKTTFIHNIKNGHVTSFNPRSGETYIPNTDNNLGNSANDNDKKNIQGCITCNGIGYYCEARVTNLDREKICTYCGERLIMCIHTRRRCDVCKGLGYY